MRKVVFGLIVFAACTPQPKVALDPASDTYLIKNEEELNFEQKVKLQEEVIKRQEEEILRQNREIQELKRQQIYNQANANYNSSMDKK